MDQTTRDRKGNGGAKSSLTREDGDGFERIYISENLDRVSDDTTSVNWPGPLQRRGCDCVEMVVVSTKHIHTARVRERSYTSNPEQGELEQLKDFISSTIRTHLKYGQKLKDTKADIYQRKPKR